MRRGHRFLAYSVGTLVAGTTAGRLAARREGYREDPAAGEPLGAIRGAPAVVPGPAGGALPSHVRFLRDMIASCPRTFVLIRSGP